MTRDDYENWLKKYGDAWCALDPDTVMQMTARENLVYYESTFETPTNDWDHVNALWQLVKTNQKHVVFNYEILMSNEKQLLAHVQISRTMVPSGEKQLIDGAFLFGFDTSGKCNYFRQWRMLK